VGSSGNVPIREGGGVESGVSSGGESARGGGVGGVGGMRVRAVISWAVRGGGGGPVWWIDENNQEKQRNRGNLGRHPITGPSPRQRKKFGEEKKMSRGKTESP